MPDRPWYGQTRMHVAQMDDRIDTRQIFSLVDRYADRQLTASGTEEQTGLAQGGLTELTNRTY